MSRRAAAPATRVRPAAVAAVVFAAVVAVLLGPVRPAGAEPLPIGECTTTSGVVLAVDFGPWGGPLLRACGSTPTTGHALLNQGGWKTAGTSHDGPGFVCRIGYAGFQGGKQFPPPEQERCVRTPPATAYWSYWHADPGQHDWTYSRLGAMSHRPKPGSVDLWVFGATDVAGTEGRPRHSPDAVRALNAQPAGSGSDTTAPSPPPAPDPGGATGGGSSGTGGTTGGTAGSGGTGNGPAPGRPTAPKPAPAAPGRSTPGTPGGPGAPSAATEPGDPAEPAAGAPGAEAEPTAVPTAEPTVAPTDAAPSAAPSTTGAPGGAAPTGGVVDAAPVADAPHDSGSIGPAAVGAALVLALGTAAVITARRRRRRAD
ncbi:hypothetical protein ACWGB8_21740 [Kitasatospora sp. NPDC054939]